MPAHDEYKPIPATQEGADQAAAFAGTVAEYLRQFNDKGAQAAMRAVLQFIGDVKPQLPAR